jgi:hypothetical protein
MDHPKKYGEHCPLKFYELNRPQTINYMLKQLLNNERYKKNNPFLT